jgi:hypothetical protein
LSEPAPAPPPAAGRRARRARALLALAAVAAAPFAVLAARAVLEGRSELSAAGAARARGDRAQAARHLGRAAGLYVPGAPHVRAALDGLATLAAEARAAGDRAAERAALEATRTALRGARSAYTPHGDRLRAADNRLAELYAELEAPAASGGEARRARAAFHRERLERQPAAAAGPAAAAIGGASLWLLGCWLFLRRGLDPAVRPRLPWAVAAAAGFVAGLVLLIAGLRAA